MKTNTDIINAILPGDHRCMWQITPKELPAGMRTPFALELHADSHGHLHLIQLFPNPSSKGPWYSDIIHAVHFQVANKLTAASADLLAACKFSQAMEDNRRAGVVLSDDDYSELHDRLTTAITKATT